MKNDEINGTPITPENLRRDGFKHTKLKLLYLRKVKFL